MTIAQAKHGFYYTVKNKTDKAAELYFYGDIVNSKSYKWSSDDKCPTDVVEALEACKDAEQLDIYINSCGGSVFAGNAIFNRLKAHKAHKTVLPRRLPPLSLLRATKSLCRKTRT